MNKESSACKAGQIGTSKDIAKGQKLKALHPANWTTALWEYGSPRKMALFKQRQPDLGTGPDNKTDPV